jgi:beta-N-acetylhexosaminidase
VAVWSPSLAVAGVLSAFTLGAAVDAPARDTTVSQAPTRPAAWALEAAGRLAVREQVGQLVVGAFEGVRAPSSVNSALRRDRLSGVILFGPNVASSTQLRRLTRSLQDAAGGSALISVDQEGGIVRRIPFAAPREGQPAQGSATRVRRIARQAANDLRSLGINVNFAPVADVPTGEGSDIRPRAFAGGPTAIADRVAAAIQGYRAGGVAATAKHFPGLGGARRKTDDASVVIRRTAMQLRRSDLLPFRSAVKTQVPLIMVAHASYPALDPERIASQSRSVITGLLRKEMHFDGAVITDALEASAVLRRSSTAAAAERSLLAGADLLLLTRPSSWGTVSRHLVARAATSRRVEIRVQQATARVLVLKRALGLPVPETARSARARP